MQLTPQILENEHVRLTPVSEADREILRPIADDPETWELAIIRGDGAHFDTWFDTMLSGIANGSQISHLVYDKHTETPVGHSAFLAIAPAHKRLEIGWTWYVASARGTQVNPAAKLLLMTRAFDAGAERVELKTHGLNTRSQRAMTKMGAVREGTLRHHTLTWTGAWRDTVFFSVLKPEWPNVRAGLEARLG